MEPSRDFRKLVQKVRGILVQECGLEMPLSTLQAFCLCHVYDTWYGSDESMFVAQCTWPIMVAHSRKKGIGVAGRLETEIQEEEAWTVWAKDEGEYGVISNLGTSDLFGRQNVGELLFAFF